jgi:hypothetical protein
MAEDEKAVAETPLWKVGLALIGVVEARGIKGVINCYRGR